jgi:hypothetical protein
MRRSIPLLAVLLAAPAAAGETNGGAFLTLTCPAKGAVTRSFDLSTGVAPWIARGPGVPNGAALATAIDPASIPKDWAARLPGARWVQALPVNQTARHAPGDFTFTLDIDLPKGPRHPHLRLEGQIAGDEGFDFNLIEPTPPNSWIGGGPAMMDDSPGVVAQDEVQLGQFRAPPRPAHRPLCFANRRAEQRSGGPASRPAHQTQADDDVRQEVTSLAPPL